MDFFGTMMQGYAPAAGGGGGPALLALSGVLALYRADVGVTSSGDVTYWSDQSGHGYHLTGSATLGPTYNATDSDFNNEPSLTFNGTNSRMTHGYIHTKRGSLGEQSGASIIAFVVPTVASIKTIAEWGNADNNSHKMRTGWSGRSEQDQFELNNALSGSYSGKIMANANPFNATSSYCVITRYTKQTSGPNQIYTNGVEGTKQVGSSPTVLSNKTTEGKLTVGANVSLASFYNFKIAELVILNNNISTADLNTVLQYGETRYGITSGSL